MWEWRIFSRESLDEMIRPEIMNVLHQAPLEVRTDDYFNYHNTGFGLKERGVMGSSSRTSGPDSPILELKIRIDKSPWGAELWKKWEIPIKRTLKEQRDKEIKLIVTYLKQEKSRIYPIYMSRYEACSAIIHQNQMKHIEVFKQRKQITAFYMYDSNKWEYIPKVDKSVCRHPPYGLLIEFTRLSIEKDVWNTVAVEGKQVDIVRRFLEENLALSVRHLRNEICGYPSFLINYSPAELITPKASSICAIARTA